MHRICCQHERGLEAYQKFFKSRTKKIRKRWLLTNILAAVVKMSLAKMDV